MNPQAERREHPKRQPPKWAREAAAKAIAEEVMTVLRAAPDMACVEGDEEDQKCS